MVGFGYVFNIEPTGLAAKLDMGWERKRGVECNCKVFGLSRWKDGVDGTEILRWCGLWVDMWVGVGQSEGQVWNAKSEMPLRHLGGDDNVQMDV